MAANGSAPHQAGARELVFGSIFKEAGLTALVSLALLIPVVGFKIANRGGDQFLETRWPEVIIAAALIFFGRILLILIREGRLALPVAGGAVISAIGWLAPMSSDFMQVVAVTAGLVIIARAVFVVFAARRVASSGRAFGSGFAGGYRKALPWVASALIVLAVVLPLLPFAERRTIDIAILVLTYVMLGWGLNIVVGLAGLLDLGYVAFYAVGAYSYALLATYFDFSFWICLPIAGLMAATFGFLLGFPVLRLRGDYLAIVTLGFGEIIRLFLRNLTDITGGPNGISNIEKPTFFGLTFERKAAEGLQTFHEYFGLQYNSINKVIFLYLVALLLALAALFVINRLLRMPIGRAWEALREDEIACRALGLNPTVIKLSAFTLGAAFAGFAGGPGAGAPGAETRGTCACQDSHARTHPRTYTQALRPAIQLAC